MPKLIRITTVPMALRYLLPGQMRYMKEQGFDVIMISADGKEREAVMAAEGCRHIVVPMTRKITPFKDLYCLWKLIRIFRKERPDIVHTHTPKAGLLGMLAAKMAGVKIRIHTVAGLPLMVEKGFKLTLLSNIEKLTYKAANHVWPNSFSLLTHIRSLRLTTEKKLKVIGKGSSNGIDIKRFNRQNLKPEILNEVKQSISFNNNNFYLVCIGRLVKDKGIIELVEVFKKLHEVHPYLRLLLVGDFEQELDPLPAGTLQEINLHPAIVHIRWTPHVEYYIALANLFVFPSHREGFPNVLLQAGVLKVPVICSKIAGNIDIIENNITGLIFLPGDRYAMENRINIAISDPSTLQIMSERLYGKITDFFTRENLWSLLLAEYNNLTDQNDYS